MGVWVLTMVSAVFTNQFEPVQLSTPVMLIYAGFLFAGRNNKKGE